MGPRPALAVAVLVVLAHAHVISAFRLGPQHAVLGPGRSGAAGLGAATVPGAALGQPLSAGRTGRHGGAGAGACFLARLRLSAQKEDSNPFFDSFLKVLDNTLT